MVNAYLVVLNETDKRNSKDAEGKKKQLITDCAEGGYMINPKGKGQFPVCSFHRVLQSTNTTDPVNTHAKDRRNVIIRCSDEKIGDTAYFTELTDALARPNALRSIYWSFRGADISNWNFRNRPITDYHKIIVEGSRNPLDMFMESFTFKYANADGGEKILYGAEMLQEFRNWKEQGGYSFGEKMSDSALIKKIQLELKLPADTITRLTRGAKGIKRRYDIVKLKVHYRLTPAIITYANAQDNLDMLQQLQGQSSTPFTNQQLPLPNDPDDDNSVETETEADLPDPQSDDEEEEE
jgi:hypothetical protein